MPFISILSWLSTVLYLFTIQGELGAGAAGIVYKAAHKTTGEEVGKYIYPG